MGVVYECWVCGCSYKADRLYCGDVPLCVLHDCPQTHAILERGVEPMHGWTSRGTPVVFPTAAALEYRAPRLARDDSVYPHECPRLAKAKPGGAHPKFDLLLGLE
jgi:hypothetical protein